jgi:hypothetical protein
MQIKRDRLRGGACRFLRQKHARSWIGRQLLRAKSTQPFLRQEIRKAQQCVSRCKRTSINKVERARGSIRYEEFVANLLRGLLLRRNPYLLCAGMQNGPCIDPYWLWAPPRAIKLSRCDLLGWWMSRYIQANKLCSLLVYRRLYIFDLHPVYYRLFSVRQLRTGGEAE